MTLEYKRLRPHQLGWLLRSDLESDHSEVWERSDGSLYYRKKDQTLLQPMGLDRIVDLLDKEKKS
jgi:hypothetical protein